MFPSCAAWPGLLLVALLSLLTGCQTVQFIEPVGEATPAEDYPDFVGWWQVGGLQGPGTSSSIFHVSRNEDPACENPFIVTFFEIENKALSPGRHLAEAYPYDARLTIHEGIYGQATVGWLRPRYADWPEPPDDEKIAESNRAPWQAFRPIVHEKPADGWVIAYPDPDLFESLIADGTLRGRDTEDGPRIDSTEGLAAVLSRPDAWPVATTFPVFPLGELKQPFVAMMPVRQGWFRRSDAEFSGEAHAPDEDPAYRLAEFYHQGLTVVGLSDLAITERINRDLAEALGPAPSSMPHPTGEKARPAGENAPYVDDRRLHLLHFGPETLSVRLATAWHPHLAAGWTLRKEIRHYDLRTGERFDLEDKLLPRAWPRLRAAALRAAKSDENDPVLLAEFARLKQCPPLYVHDSELHLLLVSVGGGSAGEQVGATLSLPLAAVGEFFTPGTLERFVEYPPAE